MNTKYFLQKELSDYKKLIIANSHINEELKIYYNFHSNKIEGNTLTLGETRVVLKDKLGVVKPLKDIYEMEAHNNALNFVIDNLLKKKEKISIETIREIHALVEPSIPGFRNSNVIIQGAKAETEEYYNIINSLEKIINNYDNSDKNLIEKVAIFHADFETIHPFFDGNGRTGRLLMNLELMKEGYPLTTIKNEDRTEYYDALEDAQVNKDYSLITEFITKSIIQTIAYVKNKIPEVKRDLNK